MYLEKALAKQVGSYEQLTEVEDDELLYALTGRKFEVLDLMQVDETWKQLTKLGPTDFAIVKTKPDFGEAANTTLAMLATDRYYFVMETVVVDGKRVVVLFDPYGWEESHITNKTLPTFRIWLDTVAPFLSKALVYFKS